MSIGSLIVSQFYAFVTRLCSYFIIYFETKSQSERKGEGRGGEVERGRSTGNHRAKVSARERAEKRGRWGGLEIDSQIGIEKVNDMGRGRQAGRQAANGGREGSRKGERGRKDV